jgi:hypothetical protein
MGSAASVLRGFIPLFVFGQNCFWFPGQEGEGRFGWKIVVLRLEGLPTAGRPGCRQASWLGE